MNENHDEGLEESAKDLHKQLFKNTEARPGSEIIKDARQMITEGKITTILIKQGIELQIGGVPFLVTKVKEKMLQLVPVAGYKLKRDSKAARKALHYRPRTPKPIIKGEETNDQVQPAES